ncbi:GIY-YIG nuclease family protein [Paenibacillus sp. CN-4]|uniref:GIY-YIG nuclease family protein n=1 Tax=Paenibacillus nanchangensis TaxID=3348343 RepID=UPI003979B148
MMEKAKRKEIGYEYAHSHRPMGVFKLYNTVNGKMLVGSSMNLDGIWNRHKFMLDAGLHDNKDMQADWKAFGEEAFRFEILEQIKPEEEHVEQTADLNKYRKQLPDMEAKWLETLSPYGEQGYNTLRTRGK